MFFYMESDNLARIKGLKNARTGQWINNATIIGQIETMTGQAVTGGEDIAFSYDGGSNGDYFAIIPHSVQFTEGIEYRLKCVITTEDDLTWTVRLKQKAKFDDRLPAT